MARRPRRDLLAELEPEAALLPLRSFDLADTATFLATQHLGRVDQALTRAAHQLTGGNPLHLQRLVAPAGANRSAPFGTAYATHGGVGRPGTWLAAEAAYSTGPLDEVLAALAETRRLGDQHALAEALSLTHHALLRPDYTTDRLALADEMSGEAPLPSRPWRTCASRPTPSAAAASFTWCRSWM